MIPKNRSPYTLKELYSAFIEKPGFSEGRLEALFAEQFEFPYGLFFNYGRSALYALLCALGMKKQNIALPAYICSVVANAITLSGNKVRFVDNETDHFIVSADNLSSALDHSIKMVIHVPLLGYPVDRKGYETVVNRKSPKAFVLYDCAQGFDTRDKYGLQTSNADGVFYGLGEGKVISSIYGGILLLRDRNIYKQVKRFRDVEFKVPKRLKSIKRLIYGTGYWMAYRSPVMYLFDYLVNNTKILDNFKNVKSFQTLPKDAKERATHFQARLAMRQLQSYGKILNERRRIVSLYTKLFDKNGIDFFHTQDAIPTHFPILTNDRDMAIQSLRKYGICADYPFSHACSDLPGFKEHNGKFPKATDMAKKLITLPVWPGMSLKQINFIVNKIIKVRKVYANIFI